MSYVGYDPSDLRMISRYATNCITISSGTLTGYPNSNAFDRDSSTVWFSNSSGNNVYIGVDFGIAKTAVSAKVIGGIFNSAYTMTSGKIQASNDGTTWTNLSAVFNTNGTTEVNVPFSTTGSYRYYRLYITAGSSNTGVANTGCSEIQLFSA